MKAPAHRHGAELAAELDRVSAVLAEAALELDGKGAGVERLRAVTLEAAAAVRCDDTRITRGEARTAELEQVVGAFIRAGKVLIQSLHAMAERHELDDELAEVLCTYFAILGEHVPE